MRVHKVTEPDRTLNIYLNKDDILWLLSRGNLIRKREIYHNMASAKKCDICGGFYELYNDKNDAEKVNGLMFLNIDDNREYYRHDPIDCCPECMSLIIDFIATLGITNTKLRR